MQKLIIPLLFMIFVWSTFLFFGACNFAPYEGKENIAIDLGDIIISESSGQEVRDIGAPQNAIITSVVISISGSGVNKVSYTYNTPQRILYIYVPPGEERTIELILNVDPNCDSAVLAFGGQTTVSLKPGQFKWVQIGMAPVETKLVIPDRNRGRVVQINSLNPATANWDWYEAGAGMINPFDIDFDNKGRIVAINNDAAAGNDIIILDDIGNVHLEVDATGPLTAVAVDKKNHFFYFCNSNTIFQYQYNVDQTALALTGQNAPPFGNILGIDVDENGLLYIIGEIMGPVSVRYVFHYDFDTNSIVGGNSINIDNATDVIVKEDYVYVAANGTPSVIRVNRSLDGASRMDYGQIAADNDDTIPGHFHGPRRFVAIPNKKFYMVDDGNGGEPNLERIASFDQPGTWAGWEAKQGNEIDAGQFFIFYDC
jgi:hypothetical protein